MRAWARPPVSLSTLCHVLAPALGPGTSGSACRPGLPEVVSLVIIPAPQASGRSLRGKHRAQGSWILPCRSQILLEIFVLLGSSLEALGLQD